MPGSIKKAVTFRASSLGDALMGKYFLENVHAAHPTAHCYMLVGSRGAMIRDLLAGYRWLEVIEANRRSPASIFRAWKKLRDADLASLQPAESPFSLPSKLFARLIAKKLVGFEDNSRWNFLYNVLVPFAGEEQSEGMIVEEQKALRAAGVPVGISDLRLSYIEDEGILSRFNLDATSGKARFNLALGEYVVLHLFSGGEGRSISQKKRVEIVRTLRKAVPYALVLTGGAGDAARAAHAGEGLKNTLNLADKTSIQELINLIAGAKAVLSLDTGAAHIAAHLRVPLVVLARKAALHAWWGSSMYQNRPTVLCNEQADDSRRFTLNKVEGTAPHPPSMEGIVIEDIIGTILRASVSRIV